MFSSRRESISLFIRKFRHRRTLEQHLLHEVEETMSDRMRFSEDDPRHHTVKLKQMLSDVVDHAREDVSKVTDPKAQALFETTAEVLIGLRNAYEDFEQKNETAWRRAS
jgi:hypothetical protein